MPVYDTRKTHRDMLTTDTPLDNPLDNLLKDIIDCQFSEIYSDV